MVVEQCCSRACARSALSVPAASHRCFALGWHVRQIPCFLQAMLLHRLFSLPLEETIRLAKSSSICCPRAPNHVEQLTLLHCSLQGLLRKLLPWVLPPPLFRGAFSNTSVCCPHFELYPFSSVWEESRADLFYELPLHWASASLSCAVPSLAYPAVSHFSPLINHPSSFLNNISMLCRARKTTQSSFCLCHSRHLCLQSLSLCWGRPHLSFSPPLIRQFTTSSEAIRGKAADSSAPVVPGR